MCNVENARAFNNVATVATVANVVNFDSYHNVQNCLESPLELQQQQMVHLPAESETWPRRPEVAVEVEPGLEPTTSELPPSYEAVGLSDEDPPPTYAESVLKEIKFKTDNTDDNADNDDNSDNDDNVGKAKIVDNKK